MVYIVIHFDDTETQQFTNTSALQMYLRSVDCCAVVTKKEEIVKHIMLYMDKAFLRIK